MKIGNNEQIFSFPKSRTAAIADYFSAVDDHCEIFNFASYVQLRLRFNFQERSE